MAFARPTLTDIVNRVETDFVSRMALIGGVLRRSVVRVFARVMAGASHMLHGHIAYGIEQLFPDKSDAVYLARWAAIFGVPRNAAAFSSGTVTFTGTNGTTVPTGSVLTRSDGVTYMTQADATIASGTATGTVRADIAALNGDASAGVVLSFDTPVVGVDSNPTVVSISGGADQEDLKEWRARVLSRIQNAPHGGDVDDYEAWAKEVSGVTRAFVVPLGFGAGTVVVYFLRDDDVGGPIPDSGEVNTVQNYLNTKRPATAGVYVVAPIADTLNFTVHLNPDTSALRTAVTAELTDLLRRESAPGVTTLLSHIRTAIGNAVGDSGDYVLSSPSADVTHATGHIAVIGTVTYV